MLVLTRRVGQTISIGDRIEIQLTRVDEQTARIGIDAPREVPIKRGELTDRRSTIRERRSRSGGRRRVVIDGVARSAPPRGRTASGLRLLREALEEMPPETLEAIAGGEAVDHRMRRALSELARAELGRRGRPAEIREETAPA